MPQTWSHKGAQNDQQKTNKHAFEHQRRKNNEKLRQMSPNMESTWSPNGINFAPMEQDGPTMEAHKGQPNLDPGGRRVITMDSDGDVRC